MFENLFSVIIVVVVVYVHVCRRLFICEFVGGAVFSLGPIAVIFACWSRHSAEMDWEGARLKGRIALWLSIAGVISTVVVALIVVLICFTKTKDT